GLEARERRRAREEQKLAPDGLYSRQKRIVDDDRHVEVFLGKPSVGLGVDDQRRFEGVEGLRVGAHGMSPPSAERFEQISVCIVCGHRGYGGRATRDTALILLESLDGIDARGEAAE